MRSVSRTAAVLLVVLIVLLVGGCLAAAAIGAVDQVGEQYRHRRADAGLGVEGIERGQAQPGLGGEGQEGGSGHASFFATSGVSDAVRRRRNDSDRPA